MKTPITIITGYLGAGKTTVTVSDGINKVTEEVVIIVNRKEEKPIIYDFEPKQDIIETDEGSEIKFTIDVSDLNKDTLSYTWKINDEIISNENGILFETDYEDEGSYKILVTVSDSISNVSKEWSVKVNNVDLNDILGQISDITVSETETASLNLPDFRKYGLSYTISEPIGNDNSWKTTYEDSGKHKVRVKAEGKGFAGEKEVKVLVKNKDRKPELIGLRNQKINENQQAVIELEAIDPDNDAITFSAEDIPQGSSLENNVFRWTPDFDFVKKEKALDYVIEKFKSPAKSKNVAFIAQGSELSDKKNVKITVKDSNRPFVLEPINGIEINEGQEIIIEPKYNDPDLDKVSFSYSGFMNSNKRKTSFDDAGIYVVKIIASDGHYTETKFINVKVNNVNIKPVFSMEDSFEVVEGQELRIEINAVDKDNDAISYSAENLPEGAEIKGNLLVWKPDFDAVNGTQKEFSVDFIATDGKENTAKKIKIIVLNKNTAPKIISASDNLIAFVNQPTVFEINAIDDDGDELKYEWDFGYFDSFEGENQHERTFTSTGSKKVEVRITDGIKTISKVWNVEVI